MKSVSSLKSHKAILGYMLLNEGLGDKIFPLLGFQTCEIKNVASHIWPVRNE